MLKTTSFVIELLIIEFLVYMIDDGFRVKVNLQNH